jgi:cysteinyl-tRNA synthetase
VLFDTASMPDYGQLSKRPLDEQQAGARVAVDAHKKSPGDFVLWKLSSPEEPGWESPWGRGRPGWHIECSAMSAAYLGEVFDIHGGGLDLIFPHHENEIAQSRCAHGTTAMANYWMHNGFLQVEGQKMSKSLGNFYSIHELLETETFGGRRWPGEVLRLAMLMTHYREPIDFSVRKLEEAESLLEKWRRKVAGVASGSVDDAFVAALSDDLDFAQYFRLMNAQDLSASNLRAAADLVGIDVSELTTDVDVSAFVSKRLAFIRDRNWAEADRIRDELLAQGIQLKDGKDSATGERVTTWEIKR